MSELLEDAKKVDEAIDYLIKKYDSSVLSAMDFFLIKPDEKTIEANYEKKKIMYNEFRLEYNKIVHMYNDLYTEENRRKYIYAPMDENEQLLILLATIPRKMESLNRRIEGMPKLLHLV